MQLAPLTPRLPPLVQTLQALAQRADYQETAHTLIHELSNITVLVARKFTNDRTADGLLEALHLTVGCISLGISQANLLDNNEAKLSFLLHHGAEHVFQMGFRHIKELSSLPYVAFISDFDRDPFVQKRNVKALFSEICRADPVSAWAGDDIYKREFLERKKNQKIIQCAEFLRAKNFAGAVKDSDLDANSVIAIAVIFAISGDRRIVARTGQKDIESLIHQVRKTCPDIETAWNDFLSKIPIEYHTILRERMDQYKSTIVKKILSKASVKSIVIAIQKNYTGDELDIEYG